MNSPRLLPVVIFAGLALLVFKGIGIVTDGGYVLTGMAPAYADGTAPAADGSDGSAGPTMTDTNPVLSDTSPTIALPPLAAANATAAATAGGHGQAVAQASPAPSPGAAPAGTAPAAQGAQASASATPPGSDPSASSDQVLQRLSQRRTQLDQREADLNMREAIVKAAETQLSQRDDALKALQSQIASMQQKQQADKGEDMSAIVKLYDTMKPQDAAGIFDGLDMNVLVHVAKAMDPRKMSPILAKMNPQKAQELTTELAAPDLAPPPEVSSVAAADPNALPQIVGH